MATVYLAEDLKHKPKVALKVLKPDLTAVLGAERTSPPRHFRRRRHVGPCPGVGLTCRG